MKHFLLISSFLALLISVTGRLAADASMLTRDNTIVVEPEQFDVLGSWRKVGGHIQSTARTGVALGGFRVPSSGNWHVWTLSRDHANNKPGTRRFLIKIDGKSVARESGRHGQEGWLWEHVGTVSLKTGDHSIEVEDTARFYGRLDAILLTTATIDPNAHTRKSGAAFRNPFRIRPLQAQRILSGARLPDGVFVENESDAAPLAVLSNSDVAVTFRAARSADGAPRVWRDVSFKNKSPASTLISLGEEPLFILNSPQNPRLPQNVGDYHPEWKATKDDQWQVAGRTFALPPDQKDPWSAGTLHRLHPVSINQNGARSATVTYREASSGSGRGLEAVITWTLPERGHILRLETSFIAPQNGFYSFAFGAGQPMKPDALQAVQLPPLFQFQRLPATPVVVTSSHTPHPFALVETKPSGNSAATVTIGVLADPGTLSTGWANQDSPACGFTLSASDGDTQPVIFTPLPGFDGSSIQKGATLSRTWWSIAVSGSWAGAMREADLSLFGLRDYREPVTTSLTDQALNIIDLLCNDSAAGWSSRLKGLFNIEEPHMVTHSAPLALLSAARLTRDEEFFQSRALPTIEYLLSRPGAHFSLDQRGNHYMPPAQARLTFEHLCYGSPVWQGIDALLGAGTNPWLVDNFIRPNHQPRPARNSAGAPGWSDLLALYRLDPSPTRLAEVRTAADAWIKTAFDPRQRNAGGLIPFYNSVVFYPYWWDLLDLYELTNDARYRDAAVQGAEHTVAGLWTAPAAPSPSTLTTLYPGGKIGGRYHVWYLPDGTVGRMGWPSPRPGTRSGEWIDTLLAIPEKKIPAWVVSPVGLGLEQPITYVRASSNYSNIQLSVWAANLLRLSGATGDDYWRIFARNTLIGRGASYPGYYLPDFIDLMQSARYPIDGPDLTSIYYHHIPVHLAMILDYLFTDADVRTKGAIRFPYVKQQGYVWFSSRIYGGAPGPVLDDPECWPWLNRDAFRVATPKVDFFGARSREKFHLVLLNQAKGEAIAPVEINASALDLTGPAVARLRTDGGDTILAFDSTGRATISLKENAWAVLTFSAKSSNLWPETTPLPASSLPLRQPLGDPWGDLHAFRIRTPFGHDSLYIALSGRPADGSKVELLLDDANASFSAGSSILDRFPYEFTVYPWPTDRAATFRLRLVDKTGKETTTPPLQLSSGNAAIQ